MRIRLSCYYDHDGKAISFKKWSRLFEGERSVALDKVEDSEISTVWLGLDYSFGFGSPLIYETMIFGGTHDGEQWGYATRKEAEEGHRQAVKLCRG